MSNIFYAKILYGQDENVVSGISLASADKEKISHFIDEQEFVRDTLIGKLLKIREHMVNWEIANAKPKYGRVPLVSAEDFENGLYSNEEIVEKNRKITEKNMAPIVEWEGRRNIYKEELFKMLTDAEREMYSFCGANVRTLRWELGEVLFV